MASQDCHPEKGLPARLCLAGVWELGWSIVPCADLKLALSDKGASLCLECTTGFVPNNAFLLGIWNFATC